MRILKAFAWMRWRVLMNSLERSGARDRLERFSLAIEQLGPIIAAVLMIPSAIVLAGAGAYGGWALAQGNPRPLPFEALRFLLFGACALALFGPLLLPATERTNAVRLLLLPIPRPMLYVAQAATTITDPWVLLAVPAVLAVPLGLAAGGAFGAAVVAAIAGVLFLVVLVGVASLATSVIHLIVRDRRRGELLALVFILVIPLVGILPGLLEGRSRATRAERRASGAARQKPAWVTTLQQRVLPLAPSEMFVRSTREAAARRTRSSAAPAASLALFAGVLHAVALTVFSRVLDAPAASGVRRRGAVRRARAWRIPGVSPQISAVALSQVRLAIRTPRGRAILLSPLMVFVMFGLMMWTGASAHFGFVSVAGGSALGIFGAFVSLLAILPIAMNQFAVDGAGLTLAFLSPLADRDLVRGKAIGNGIVAGAPALACIAGGAAIFGGPIGTWITVALGVAAAYLIVTPVAAVLSAIFPRPVDLNSIGHGSNAHGAAGFLGFVAFGTAGAMSLAVALLAVRVFRRPDLMPLFMLAWLAACAAVSHLLIGPAAAVLSRRRENLALIR